MNTHTHAFRCIHGCLRSFTPVVVLVLPLSVLRTSTVQRSSGIYSCLSSCSPWNSVPVSVYTSVFVRSPHMSICLSTPILLRLISSFLTLSLLVTLQHLLPDIPFPSTRFYFFLPLSSTLQVSGTIFLFRYPAFPYHRSNFSSIPPNRHSIPYSMILLVLMHIFCLTFPIICLFLSPGNETFHQFISIWLPIYA